MSAELTTRSEMRNRLYDLEMSLKGEETDDMFRADVLDEIAEIEQSLEDMPTLQPMKFNQTYEIITDESAEHGDTAEHGFDWQDVEFDFRGLVKTLEWDYAGAEPSDSHGVPRWITSHGDRDFRTGEFRNISLHPANDRAKRWWPKALRAAGTIRKGQEQ